MRGVLGGGEAMDTKKYAVSGIRSPLGNLKPNVKEELGFGVDGTDKERTQRGKHSLHRKRCRLNCT